MINLSYVMDHILYQIFKIIFDYIIEKHEAMTDNSPIRIYINKMGNRVTFKIKTGHYFELLTFGTMKVHGSTKIKINNNQNTENVPHLQITNIVLVHFAIVIIIDNDYQHSSRVFYKLVPNKLFRQLLFISLKIFGIF